MLQGTFFHFTLLAVDEIGWGTIVHIYLIKCFRVLDPELPFLVATELLPSIKRQATGQHVECGHYEMVIICPLNNTYYVV